MLAGLLVALTLPLSVASRGDVDGPRAGYSFVGFWGETGDGPGQFHEPMGIAVGRSGELYVADTRNHRIQVLSPDGELIRKWGTRGDGPGEFAMPVDVAVGPGGSVYVSDYELDRVQRFTAEGEYRLGWGTSGEGDREFEAPAGLFVGPDQASRHGCGGDAPQDVGAGTRRPHHRHQPDHRRGHGHDFGLGGWCETAFQGRAPDGWPGKIQGVGRPLPQSFFSLRQAGSDPHNPSSA